MSDAPTDRSLAGSPPLRPDPVRARRDSDRLPRAYSKNRLPRAYSTNRKPR